jgi:reverse transcriptase-like protein
VHVELPIAPPVRSALGRLVRPVSRYGMPSPMDYLHYCFVIIDDKSAATSTPTTLTRKRTPMTDPLFEPKSFKQATSFDNVNRPEWRAAVQAEYDSLTAMNVWSLVPRPPHVNVIRGMWVFTIKRDENGRPTRYKARFVVKGFEQKEGVDFNATFAPVLAAKSIRLLLALAADQDLELKQIDVKTAFLNAHLNEKIYVEQPEGFRTNPSLVCLLHRALYGLKQAPHEWNVEVNRAIIALGYMRSMRDPCMYFKRWTDGTTGTTNQIMIGLYVDDKLIAYNKEAEQQWLSDFSSFKDKYQLDDKGDCTWILNMSVTRDRTAHTITLSQEAYVNKLLEQQAEHVSHGKSMLSTKVAYEPTAGTEPIGAVLPLELNGREHKQFMCLVGGLLYLANTTRMDISWSVGAVSRKLSQPTNHDLTAAKRILRYLAGTKTRALLFKAATPGITPLVVWTDADWAADKVKRRSTTGTLVQFNGNVVSWNSRLQKSTAQSTAEAEYVALNDAVREAHWMRDWLREIAAVYPNDIPVISSVTVPGTGLSTGTLLQDITTSSTMVPSVMCDNMAAIQIAKKGLASAPSTKHIAIKYYDVQRAVELEEIRLQYVPSADQLADILTKRLGGQQIAQVIDKLLVKTASVDTKIPEGKIGYTVATMSGVMSMCDWVWHSTDSTTADTNGDTE